MLTDEEIMAQVLAAFQEEQEEHRQTATDILLELEREPDHPRSQALLDQLFREAHSLKGGARAAGLDGVEQIAHRMEDVFSVVRQGKLQLTPDVCDSIYAGMDAIGVMMTQVAAGHPPDLEPHQTVLDALSHILGETVEKPTRPPQPPHPLQPPHPTAAAPPKTSQKEHPAPPPAPQEPAAAPPPAPAVPEDLVAATSLTVAAAEEQEPSAPAPPAPPAPSRNNDRLPLKSGTGTGTEMPEPSPGTSSGDMPWDAVATVRLSTATLDHLLNETGELITCSVRSQQRSRESHLLAELPLRWRRVWRQIRPLISRLQMALPSFQPTVHHLDDRQSQIDMRTVEQAAARILNQNQGERGGKSNKNDSGETDLSAMSSQIPLLLDALTQANSLITELEQSLGQHARQSTEDYTRLSVVTDRLHDQIRRTRMLPLATLFNPLRLQLREIVRAAGKQVDLELDDGGAEADRQVLERLREVLLHLLRNAVDHGIESPEQRTAHGKSPTGHITLRAVVSGDYLTITIEDDGAGLELDEIRRKAIGGGLLSDADITRVTEAELIDLIFLPGFSTRQMVSKMSGRGVGLDIVRSQVERMHGRVTVQSFPGAGCAFTISVPLSLTSSHGLLLRVAHDTYMVPLDSIQRIVAVAPGEVQVLEGRTCLTLDHRPVALVHLADIVGKTERPAVKEERRPGGERGRGPLVNGRLATSSWSLALILGSGERQVACMVDAVLGEQELVIYRLPAPLQRIRFIAGATILADGSVVPILDVVDVVRAAIGVRQAMSFSATEVAQQERRNTILVVDDSITTRTLEKNILEAAGYEVKLATDGVEALDMLRQLVENDGGCDLLLSDIDMPRLNGFDLTSQVRNDASFKHLPIVLVTSLDSPADRERGIAAGADAYIVKRAFDQQNLLETIEQLI